MCSYAQDVSVVGGGELSGVSYKATNPMIRAPLSWPRLAQFIFQRLQISSYWELELQDMNLGGYCNIQSIRPLNYETRSMVSFKIKHLNYLTPILIKLKGLFYLFFSYYHSIWGREWRNNMHQQKSIKYLGLEEKAKKKNKKQKNCDLKSA